MEGACFDGRRDSVCAKGVYHRRRTELVKFLNRLTKDSHLSEDLAHEALVRAFEGRGCPRQERGALRWLRRTAFHLWVDTLRRRSGRESCLIDEDEWVTRDVLESRVSEREVSVAGRHVDWGWLRSQVPGALRGLPDIYRDLMKARYLRGESFRSLARREGLSVGSIKTRLYRGRKILARILERRIREHLPAPGSAFITGRECNGDEEA